MTTAMAKTILRLAKAAKASPTLKKLYARFGGGAKAKAMARKLAKPRTLAKNVAGGLAQRSREKVKQVRKAKVRKAFSKYLAKRK